MWIYGKIEDYLKGGWTSVNFWYQTKPYELAREIPIEKSTHINMYEDVEKEVYRIYSGLVMWYEENENGEIEEHYIIVAPAEPLCFGDEEFEECEHDKVYLVFELIRILDPENNEEELEVLVQ